MVCDGGCSANATVSSSSSSSTPNVANLITNADQGVVLSFQVAEGITSSSSSYGCFLPCQNSSSSSSSPGANNSYLATISSGGSVSLAQLNVPGQSGPIQPVLQAQDNSFVGMVSTQAGTSMIAFDQSGNQRWMQSNYTPQIATSDGGVIATLQSGQAVTFDATGKETGQLANFPIQSWAGYAYQLGSTEQVSFVPTSSAASFWAFQGANQSGKSTATLNPQYPQLVSCYASDNPTGVYTPPCPGPRQLVWNAYKALAIQNPLNSAPAILITNKSSIQTWVFNKLNGPNWTPDAYITFLQKGFSPYDGTSSSGPVSLIGISSSASNQTVKQYFSDPGQDASTVVNQPQLTIFVNASNFITSNYGVNTFNVAVIFHEGLHGFTGMNDPQLQQALGCTQQLASINITDYLEQFVFNAPPQNPTPCQ